MNTQLIKHSEKLYSFYEVASAGSFQAAARKLNTTASTLSYSVDQFEKVLGSKLFMRSRSGVTLTNVGKDLLSFCKKTFRELDDIYLSGLNGAKRPLRIRFGTFHSIAIYLGPALLDQLSEQNDISLNIKTDRSSAILESLIKNEIDLALTVENFKHPHLITHELYDDYYSFYVAKEAPASIGGDLQKTSLIYMPEASDHKGISLDQHVRAAGLQFREFFHLDSLEVVAEFTRKGLGIGLLPQNVAKSYKNELKLLKLPRLPKKFGKHRFFLSYRNDLDLPQSVMQTFLELSRSAVMKFFDN